MQTKLSNMDMKNINPTLPEKFSILFGNMQQLEVNKEKKLSVVQRQGDPSI
jgi:hypothetical protein